MHDSIVAISQKPGCEAGKLVVKLLELFIAEGAWAAGYVVAIAFSPPIPRNRVRFAHVSISIACLIPALFAILWGHTTTDTTMIQRYILVGAVCAASGMAALAGIDALRVDREALPVAPTPQPPSPQMSGGRGGDATVIGSGTAIGGPWRHLR